MLYCIIYITCYRSEQTYIFSSVSQSWFVYIFLKMSLDKNNNASSLRDLFVTSKGTLKSFDSFDKLKQFCDNRLKIGSKWLSPGGGCKSLDNEDVVIRWYSTNKSHVIKGPKGELLRNEFKLIAKPVNECLVIGFTFWRVYF
jgi:hypothetical protein